MSADEVVFPDSPEAAVEAFGDGSEVTLIAGGTIILPLVTYGRIAPTRAVMLTNAGLSYVNHNGSSVTVGAMTPLSEIADLFPPVGPCVAGIGDPEIQGQATVGGNLCAPTPPEHPAGDLQGPFLALGASVRSAGEGGERTEPVEDFLSHRHERLVLDVSFDEPAAGAFEVLDRPHTHHFTALAVSGVRSADGATRLAATGAGPAGIRLTSAERVADDPTAAGEAALADAEFRDDALASMWYRARMLPLLVGRVLAQLEEAS